MRAVRIFVFAALAASSLITPSPALAADAPSCFNSEMATVRDAFFEAAPDGSAMEDEGEARMNQMASNGLSGGIVSGELIKIADKYGYRWDCPTESFVLKTPPTTASSTTTTMPTTTTTRPTVTSSSTTSTMLPVVVDYPDINIVVPPSQATPSPTSPQVKTSVTTRTTAPSNSAAGASATQSSDPSTTTSTAAAAGSPQTDVVAAPASHQGDNISSGGNGTVLLLAVGLAAALGIGGGVLIGLRRRQQP